MKQRALWVLLVLLSIATPVVYKTAWGLGSYWWMLSSLGALAVIAGITVLWRAGFKLGAVIAVVGCLIVGQWWFVQMAIVMAFWKVRGFAP